MKERKAAIVGGEQGPMTTRRWVGIAVSSELEFNVPNNYSVHQCPWPV